MNALRILFRWWRSDDYKAEKALDKIQRAYEAHYDGKITDAELAQIVAVEASKAEAYGGGIGRARKP